MMNKEKKKTHGVQLLLRFVVTDPDGKVITDTGRNPSKSFLIQFLQFVYAMARGTDQNAKDTAGANNLIYRAATGASQNLKIKAAVAADIVGIVVGTGDTAEANDDYQLETQLTEGVGGGNITHGACTVGVTAEVGANVDMEIIRSFVNQTGSAIGVKEAGIYSATRDMYYHCIARDVLPGTVDVPDMCSLSAIYTLRTTV